MTTRNAWGSRLGFILAAAGSAIGLGAIWKFPYVTAMNGGGAFLLLFLIFSFTLGLALMMAEIALGRSASNGAVGAFKKIGGKPWALLGLLGVIAGFVLFSFYSVVGGWTFAYLGKAIDGSVLSADPKALEAMFGSFVSDPIKPLITHALFTLATLGIVLGGIEKGIERAGKVLMPALFIIMLILMVRSLTLPGAWAGVVQFLAPDWSRVNPSMVVEALGLAFFSLSLGVGAMVAYGSYMHSSEEILSASLWVVFLAVMIALLAGLMIFPAVAAFGLNPSAGPGLTFMTMPVVFMHLPFGQLFAIAFFALLATAALSSSVAMLELIAIWFIDDLKLPRRWVLIGIALAVFLCGIPASWSFGIWSDVRIFGKSIFDAMDYFVSNLAMPVGGIGLALLAGWKGDSLVDEVGLQGWKRQAWLITCRYLAPVLITTVLVKNL